MTVNELLATLQRLSNTKHGDETVKVKTYDPSIGPSSAVDIERVQVGFDWDHGTIFLFPTEQLVTKKK